MASTSATIESLKAKVEELEWKIFGEEGVGIRDADRQTVIDDILLLDRELASKIDPTAKYYLMIRSMKVLNDMLETSLKEDDSAELEMKLDVIFSEQRKLQVTADAVDHMKNFSKDLLSNKFKNVDELKDNLTSTINKSLLLKERTQIATESAAKLVAKLNEVSYELSRYFFLVHEALTKLENAAQGKSTIN